MLLKSDDSGEYGSLAAQVVPLFHASIPDANSICPKSSMSISGDTNIAGARIILAGWKIFLIGNGKGAAFMLAQRSAGNFGNSWRRRQKGSDKDICHAALLNQ